MHSPQQRAQSSVTVIDPANRTGKVQVPARYVVPTEGHRQAVEEGAVVSLCMLYQRGRCRAGAQCRQVHAERSFVVRLREQASTSCTCCAEHGDCRAVEPEFRRHLISDCHIAVAPSSNASRFAVMMTQCGPLPIRRFGRTVALEQLLRGGVLVVPENKVCRLHMDDRCRFGKDCKNFHICRELMGGRVNAAASPSASSAHSPSRARGYSSSSSVSSWTGTEEDCGLSSCPASPAYSNITAPPSPVMVESSHLSVSSRSSVSLRLPSSRCSTPTSSCSSSSPIVVPPLEIEALSPKVVVYEPSIEEDDWCTQPPTPRRSDFWDEEEEEVEVPEKLKWTDAETQLGAQAALFNFGTVLNQGIW